MENYNHIDNNRNYSQAVNDSSVVSFIDSIDIFIKVNANSTP